jgi:hypothetical protein
VEKNLIQEKPKLKLDWCTHKAAKYAVEHWHYSRCIPKSKLVKFGVWENDIFIGSIIYGSGACNNLLKPYGLKQDEGCELVRIALKKHYYPVSKMINISLNILKKTYPKLKIVISFADRNENHYGGIYQASNWIYSGKSNDCYFYKDKNGKIWHPRNVSKDLHKPSICISPDVCEKILKIGKHRYLYPLNKKMRKQILKLSKPYPKNADAHKRGSGVQSEKGGANPTHPLHI